MLNKLHQPQHPRTPRTTTKATKATKSTKTSQQKLSRRTLITTEKRPITTPPAIPPSHSNLPAYFTTSGHHGGNNNNSMTTNTQQHRKMAFSFDKKQNYNSVKPVQREPFPWEKHNDQSLTKGLVNATIYDVDTANDDNEQDQSSHHTRPPLTSFGNTRFSFSSLHSPEQQQQQQQQPSTSSGHSQSTTHHPERNILIPESRLGGRLTGVMHHHTVEAQKRSDVTGVAVNDLDTMFKNSPLSGVFSQQHAGPTFWAQITETPTLYFIGTRKVMDGASGTSAPTTFAFLKRHVNKKLRTIRDEFTTYSHDDDGSFTSTVVSSLEADLTRGTAKELGSALPPGRTAKSVIRYRGVGWKWHASVQMSQITTDKQALAPGANVEPDVFTATRSRFTLNSYLSEKLVRSGNTIVATVVDDMKLVDKEHFDLKLAEAISAHKH